jgi:octaprenyl-diphosphate synthase
MLGDILYSKGFLELNKIDIEVSKMISNAVVQLSLGELKDVSLSKGFNTDKSIYMEMIYQKTASLIEASAGVGAYLGNKAIADYKTYGRNLGLAFQMIDDILDIRSDATTLGKPALHDFEEGKTTLPYIYLYECLENNDKIKLKSLHKKHLLVEESLWIKEKMQTHKVIEKSLKEARVLVEEAIALMSSKGEDGLRDIALAMIEREF